ncbi:hypothetical protein bplSymb_SCF03502P017 [Bathymodiolus platifrons methanotrophic gill symbiont]|uniref:DAHL domain-containing protein n=2 Tax=Bathymodiolus platifrons methanotrophic gill symbiont TaxID=113268 RepID=UPI000B41BA7C|nr:DAHL domain-containing protein [Bathymodiolus platifrons methanotrophic gill symbiont]GAW86682.1 hypothetical protein bplSymb_SCF03502P017 [Bathymodiolus platifrons methanotrophic gill symbiont]GFO77406.1 hypothetical protein BPLS_P5837 [Bathymodiolus platifrons methanotrophic gill symbiont]
MNRVIKTLPLFFILAMLILATGFFSLAQVESKTYQNNTDLIRYINEQTSLLSSAILFVVEGVNKDYDSIAHVQQDLLKLIQQLTVDMPEVITLKLSVVNLNNQVEHIKSVHAIYRNSALFFPTASRQLHQRLKINNQANELIMQLHTLERNLLLFHLSPDSFDRPVLEQDIQLIKNNSVIVSLNTETRLHLDLWLKHVQIIINHRLKLDRLLTNLLKSPIAEQSHIILALYDADYQYKLARAETMRKGFYISAFLLIISVILVLKFPNY